MNNSTFSSDNKTFCRPITIYFYILSYDGHYYSYLYGVIVLNAIVSFGAAVSNFLIICTIAKTPSLRTPSNILILGLALADLGSSLLTQPSFCFYLFADIQHDVHLLCQAGRIYVWSAWLFIPVSFATLLTVTVDRFLAVKLHLRYQELITVQRYGIVLLFIWAYGVGNVVAIILVSIRKSFALLITGSIIAGFFVCANSYFLIKISRVIRRHSVQIQAQQQSVQQSIDMPRYKKSVNTMYYVLGAFLLCYVPIIITLFVDSILFKDKDNILRYMYGFSCSFILANGIFSPVLYFWRIEGLRTASFKLLRQMCKTETQSV